MYYQNLTNMKLDRWIRKSDVKKLDEWLIRVPYRNRHNLNFLNFSIDKDINEEIALRLFMSATTNETKVLELTYNIVTDDRMQSLGVYQQRDKVPARIYDYDLNKYIEIKDSNIELRFKLIALPTKTFSISDTPKKKVYPTPTLESAKGILNHEEFSTIFK